MAGTASRSIEGRSTPREECPREPQVGCFAGAVWTDDADDLACLDVEGGIREHHLIGVLLADRIHPQQGLIVSLFGGAGSFHRKRRIASDWRIWRDQVENSVLSNLLGTGSIAQSLDGQRLMGCLRYPARTIFLDQPDYKDPDLQQDTIIGRTWYFLVAAFAASHWQSYGSSCQR
jgi:hypothetical protein